VRLERQPRLFAGPFDQPGEPCSVKKGALTLRHEDGKSLVRCRLATLSLRKARSSSPCMGCIRRHAALRPFHVEPGLVEVDLVPSQIADFRCTEPIAGTR